MVGNSRVGATSPVSPASPPSDVAAAVRARPASVIAIVIGVLVLLGACGETAGPTRAHDSTAITSGDEVDGTSTSERATAAGSGATSEDTPSPDPPTVLEPATAASSSAPAVTSADPSIVATTPVTSAAPTTRDQAPVQTAAPSPRPPRDPGRNHAIRTTFFDNGMRPLAGVTAVQQSRSWGVVSAPTDGTGPFPLVVIIHGAHTFCREGRPRAMPCAEGAEVPNHDGFSSLTEPLARNGFVAVAVGVNEEYAHPGPAVGSVVVASIERDVLGPLALNRPYASFLDPSVVDRSRVVLVGHSRGGAIAAVIGRRDVDRRLSVPVTAAVLLAPTADTVEPALLADVPTAVLIGSCDGDSGVGGGHFLTSAWPAARRHLVALLLLTGATHNATNDRLELEPADAANPDCAPSVRLTPEVQRARTAVLVPEIIRALIGLPTVAGPASVLVDPHRADDRVADGVRVVHLDPTAARTVLLDPSQPWPIDRAVASGMVAVHCPPGYSSPFRHPGTENCHRVELSELVGRPATFHLDWSGPGASLRLAVPPIEQGKVLVLRIYADPLLLTPGTVVEMSVTGHGDTNGDGLSEPGWSFPINFPVAVLGEPVAAVGLRRGAVLWSERRIVVPVQTTSITLTINAPSAGGLDIVGVETVTPG